MGLMAGVNLNYLLLSSAALGQGKIPVRVDPEQSLYATYSNVKGIPAPEGHHGLSLTGLKILDSIVENIRAARNARSETPDGLDSFRRLVQEFRHLQDTMGPYAPGVPRGLLLDLTA